MKIIDAQVILGKGQHTFLTVDELLGLMDQAGITLAIARSADRFLAVGNQEGNNFLLKAMHEHPDRIVGLGSVNPWYGKKAAEELKRVLNEGLMGVYINSFYQGVMLADPILNPLLEIAQEFNVPVFAPTGLPLIAEPFQFTEMAMCFPEINFVMCHAGASDYYHDAVKAPGFAQNLWLETSRNGPSNFGLFKVRGVMDKCVFGSSAPEYGPATEIDIIQKFETESTVLEKLFALEIQQVFKGKLPL